MKEKTLTLDEKFFKYHERNPHIYDLIYKYTKQIIKAGFDSYGIWAIMNRVRWHVNIETRDPDGFKINNNNASRYARLLMKDHEELRGFFRIRKLKTFSTLGE